MKMKISELRGMSDEQLQATLNQTIKDLFRLRIKSQMERLDAPSELKKHRRIIAQIKTLISERELSREVESLMAEAE